MINRILIRIKVVQLLYSYLLTRSEFNIEPAPVDTNSQEKKLAYNIYLDLLLFILELSGYDVKAGGAHPVPQARSNRQLRENRLVKAINTDEKLRRALLIDPSRMAAFDAAASEIYDDIRKSSLWRSYTHRKDRDIASDAAFWIEAIRKIILPNKSFISAIRCSNDTFSFSALEKGAAMAIDTISNFSENKQLLVSARRSLDNSLMQAYQLYHALLRLIVDITRAYELRIDNARHKYLPSAEDLNPDTRLADNRLAAMLADDGRLDEFFKDHPFSWEPDHVLVKSLLDKILASDIYAAYTASQSDDFAADCEFWRAIFKSVILPSDELAEALEDKSIYWNDDLAIIGTFVLKSLKRFASGGPDTQLLPMFKDDEDARFGAELFTYAVNNSDTYRGYIDMFLKDSSWDAERLALMDVVIMFVAIAELINYPAIPVAVTMNEYIEIANAYSTPRSGQFINGILYSVTRYLNEQGLIAKNV